MFLIRFENVMNERKLNKAQLIRATGITEGAIDGWRKKGTQPTADCLCKLADFFEVSTDYLLGRENEVGLVEVKTDLTADEQELLNLYRKLSFGDKNQLLGFAKGLIY